MGFFSFVNPMINDLGTPAEVIQKMRREKMKAMRDTVASPFAHALVHRVDKDARVLVSGSVGRSEQQLLRATSDFDLIVLSNELRDPYLYIMGLKQLNTMSNDFYQDTGFWPYWFTRVAVEMPFQHIAENFAANKINTNGVGVRDHMLACHFLFYHSLPNMMAREPDDLVEGLLGASTAIQGVRPNVEVDLSKDPYPHGLDAVRWRVETALAELILNQRRLPENLMVESFAQSMYVAMRSLKDIVGKAVPPSRTGVASVMEEHLGDMFFAASDILDIQFHGYNGQGDIRSWIEPAKLMLEWIDRKTIKCE